MVLCGVKHRVLLTLCAKTFSDHCRASAKTSSFAEEEAAAATEEEEEKEEEEAACAVCGAVCAWWWSTSSPFSPRCKVDICLFNITMVCWFRIFHCCNFLLDFSVASNLVNNDVTTYGEKKTPGNRNTPIGLPVSATKLWVARWKKRKEKR